VGDVPVSQYPVGTNHGPDDPDVEGDTTEGAAVVECDVGRTGRTSACKVDSVTGSTLFGTQALNFVQSNIFNPAIRCGVPIDSHRVWTYRFRLTDK